MPESKFTPTQAEELAAAFAREGVDYLFIGKSGAILLGYPDTTQDVDIFLLKSLENAERVLCALRTLGLELDPALTVSILTGSEIVLLKTGPLRLGFDSRAGWHRKFRGSEEPLRLWREAAFRSHRLTTSSQASARRDGRRIFTMWAGLRSSESNISGDSSHDMRDAGFEPPARIATRSGATRSDAASDMRVRNRF